jgi:hypothetical protein
MLKNIVQPYQVRCGVAYFVFSMSSVGGGEMRQEGAWWGEALRGPQGITTIGTTRECFQREAHGGVREFFMWDTCHAAPGANRDADGSEILCGIVEHEVVRQRTLCGKHQEGRASRTYQEGAEMNRRSGRSRPPWHPHCVPPCLSTLACVLATHP